MTTTTCPACGHAFATTRLEPAAPHRSVVAWFRGEDAWTGEASTDEVYVDYLRATTGEPVSRGRFVSDLAQLGVEQVLDDETYVLLRP